MRPTQSARGGQFRKIRGRPPAAGVNGRCVSRSAGCGLSRGSFSAPVRCLCRVRMI